MLTETRPVGRVFCECSLGVLGGTLDGHELKFAPIFFAQTASLQGKPVSDPSRKSSFSREELLQCCHGRLFGPDCACLPLPNMLMLDRIVQISAVTGQYRKGRVVAELDLHPSQWFFQGHFQDDPIMPGSLGLDALWQTLGFFLCWQGCRGKGRALGVGEVKFKKQILPTARRLTYQVDIKKIATNHSTIAFADGKVFVDDQEAYTASSLQIGLLRN